MADKKKESKNIKSSSISQAERKLLDFIGQFESNGGDYNILYGGYKDTPKKPITEMTLNEVYDLQEKMKDSGSSAVGAHQFINKTLKDVAKQMKLKGDEKFTPELQDKMILHRLNKTRGFDDYLAGKIDEEEFALNLSKEFASMPNPKTGRSYYDGDGLNKSLTDVDSVLGQLSEVKKTYELAGDQSINPEEIINNPNLDDGTKEELLKANESEGLAAQTIKDIRSTGSPTNEVAGGYTGALNVGSLLTDTDTSNKKKKAQEQQVANPQAQEIDNQAQSALGYTGEIGAFASDFNLLNQEFRKGGRLNPDPTDKNKKDKKLNKQDVDNINNSSGVNFTSDAANSLFTTVDPNRSQTANNINFGRYKDVGYFKQGNTEGDTFRVQNTQSNPHNPSTIKPVMDEIRKLNPDKNIALDYNSFEKGGKLNTESGANIVTEYDQGGAHENNKHGGIPVGTNSQGGMNLVEQGETRFGDYIYSNDYELTKEDAKRFNLNSKYIGKSYSDISRDINDEMKTRPYDRLVKKTSEGNLNKLMMAQETVRQQEAMNNPETTSQEQQFNAGGPMGSFLPELGQQTNAVTDAMGSGASQTGGGPGMAGIAGAATGALGLGQMAFGKSQIDTSGLSGRQETGSLGGSALGGAAKGAQAGMAFGPWGAAIGGVVGAGAGLLGGSKNQKAALEANRNASIIQNNQFTTEDTIAKKGGLLDKYLARGGYTDPNDPTIGFGRVRNVRDMNHQNHVPGGINQGVTRNQFQSPGLTGEYRPSFAGVDEINNMQAPKFTPGMVFTPVEKEPEVQDSQTSTGTPDNNLTPGIAGQIQDVISNLPQQQKRTPTSGIESYLNQSDVINPGLEDNAASASNQFANSMRSFDTGNSADNSNNPESSMRGFQPEELLRYAPTVGNALQLMNLPDAETETYDRLDQRYRKDPMDEMALQNRVSQSAANTRSAIQNASGGSQAATRASLLGSQINEQRGLSDAYLQADQVNRAENQAAQQFNLGVDQYNQQVDTQETIANAQNRAARETQKQALMQSLLNDAGAMGKEAKLARILENTSGGYRSDGTKRGAEDQITMMNKLSNIFKKKGGTLDIARSLFEK